VYCRKQAKSVVSSFGSMILVNNIDFIDRSEIKNLTIENICEISAIELLLNIIEFVLVCIYRPPTGNIEIFFTKFEFIVNKTHKENKVTIFCGDFNITLLEITTTSNSCLDLIHICNLQQTIFNPTQYCKPTATLINNIFIGKLNPHEISNCVVLNCPFSDHEAQVTTFRYSPCNTTTTPKTTKHRVFSEHNEIKFQTLLRHETWQHVYKNVGDMNELLGLFHTTILNHYNTAFPLTNLRIFNKK
jgi:hypothetical protein